LLTWHFPESAQLQLAGIPSGSKIADPCAFNRTGDNSGKVLARRAEFADHLPDGVSGHVDR
jgi:hypothetical protein